MRYSLALVSLLLAAAPRAQDLPGPGEGVYTWERVGDAPVNVRALAFASSGTIHAGVAASPGEQHRILTGPLPGAWVEVDNHSIYPEEVIAVIPLGTGAEGDTLIASVYGSFRRTVDGGSHWAEFDDFDPTTGGSISGPAPDRPHGFVELPDGHAHAGRIVAGYAAFSDDRGATWTEADKSAFHETDFRAGSFAALPSGRLLGAGYWGVAVSDDGGETWTPTDVYAQYGRDVGAVLALATPGSQQALGAPPATGTGGAIAVGYQTDLPGLRVYRTADGGQTWSAGVELPQFIDGVAGTSVAGAVALAPGPDGLGRAVVVVGRGFVYGTSDGGATWDVLGRLPVDASSLRAKVATLGPDGHLWVGLFRNNSDGAWLYRSAEAAEAGVAVSQEPPAAADALGLSVGPNPSRGAATVTVAPPSPAASVRVEVFDALGRRVVVLHDGPAVGPLSLPLDASGWAPGVYHVHANAGSSARTSPLSIAR